VCINAPLLFAQNGQIKGVVSEAATGETLPGANIIITGTSLGAATNLEGEYQIARIPAGTYKIIVSFIGYKPDTAEVKVLPNRAIEQNFKLFYEVIEGEIVMVTAQAEGQMRAINQQVTSNTIVNIISEEKIQELPDANAAEAIGRLPGVSLQRSGGEANRVVLRGLSSQYSTITIDGVRMAPTDADARGVDLSTISQGSLAGIELYKALTPDKDADAIAGSVNLVTKKAPYERLIRIESKGAYNKLADSYDQYDFRVRYGERFFNDKLGIQVSGNIEKRDRSKENIDLDYNLRGLDSGYNYEITNFTLNYTDEVRDRNGYSVLLDYNTPDGGSIRINNVYNQTQRDFIEFERNYPTTGEELYYTARDREQQINAMTNAINGENYLFGLQTTWGLSYSNSRANYPFDYEMNFLEPSTTDKLGNPLSGMRAVPADILKGDPENIIQYALNNFASANLYTAYFRGEENNDTEKAAYLNIARSYNFGKLFAGEFKIGGKYRDRVRDRERSELLSPYYNEKFAQYVNDNGAVIPKDFTGTRFADLQMVGNLVLMTNFLDANPVHRDVYDKYDLYPLFNRDAVREWWSLNRYGYSDATGKNPEYEKNLEPDALFYDINERISSAYVMNTLNWGQKATLITGLRMENENNDYDSRFSPVTLSGFPVPKGVIKDTTASHNETVWLPNFHLTIRPLNIMNVRFAAYKALARPDFNYRLASVVTRAQSFFYSGNSLYVGNPDLKAAKAWNFEINTSLFNDKIGLFSVSAFYKDIDDMYHIINGLPIKGQKTLDSLGINLKSPFTTDYNLTFPINSSKATIVKGIEIEHQANLLFLPGLFKNIVLSYNMAFIESETWIPSSNDTVINVISPTFPFPIPTTVHRIEDKKQKLEGQPEFFGNVALGYDIGGFSARLSLFYQGEYNSSFSTDSRSDNVVDGFTRLDLALKQNITKNIALLLNLNNLTNTEEGTSIRNRVVGWHLLNESEKYGLSAELGLRVTL